MSRCRWDEEGANTNLTKGIQFDKATQSGEGVNSLSIDIPHLLGFVELKSQCLNHCSVVTMSLAWRALLHVFSPFLRCNRNCYECFCLLLLPKRVSSKAEINARERKNEKFWSLRFFARFEPPCLAMTFPLLDVTNKEQHNRPLWYNGRVYK